jgi:biopolymer transport protein ExbB
MTMPKLQLERRLMTNPRKLILMSALAATAVAMAGHAAWAMAPAAAEQLVDGPATGQESMFTLVLKGGPTMVPLFLCSILAVTFFLERLISLRSAKIVPANFTGELRGLLQDTKNAVHLESAIQYCENNRSSMAAVVRRALLKMKLKLPSTEVEKAVEEEAGREASRLRKSLNGLKFIASIATLLGLLGTVYGLIECFMTIAQSNEPFGRAQRLASGIYQAMVTTASGLTIAIPTLVFFFLLTRRLDSHIDNFELACDSFIDEFVKAKKKD